LDLTAPASDVLLKNRRSSWVQLSGHPGCFAPAGLGTLWKKQGTDYNEQLVYEALMKDSACDIVPKFYRNVVHQGESEHISIFSNTILLRFLDVLTDTMRLANGRVSFFFFRFH
jgi:hypothetical protein